MGDLKSITLSATPSTNLVGEGGLIQLQAVGVYSTGTQKDLSNRVTFAVSITPGSVDDTGAPLPTPPQTMSINSTGLVTAVSPFICTWVDTAPSSTTPSWAISGSYQVVASFGKVSSQPLFVTVGSAISSTNPKGGQCGP